MIKKPVSITEILEYPPEKHKWLYESKTHQKKAPQSFRHRESVEEVRERLNQHIINLLHGFTEIHRIQLSGRIGEEDKTMFFEAGGNIHYSEESLHFSVEDKEYKLFPEKSKVSSPHSNDYDEAVKHLNRVREFLDNLPK